MSTRTIELRAEAFDLVRREADRRGITPEQVIEDMVKTDLGPSRNDLKTTLQRAAALRANLPEIDGVALARAAREELQARGS